MKKNKNMLQKMFNDKYFEDYSSSTKRISNVISVLKLDFTNKNVFDFGCGNGLLTNFLDSSSHYVGYDSNLINTKYSKIHMKNTNFTNHLSDFKEMKFDYIFAIDVFNFMSDGEVLEALIFMRESMHPKSKIIIHEPTSHNLLTPYWRFRFRKYPINLRNHSHIASIIKETNLKIAKTTYTGHYSPILEKVSKKITFKFMQKSLEFRVIYEVTV